MPDTVNTMPLETLNTYRRLGRPELRLERHIAEGSDAREGLERLGVDLEERRAAARARGRDEVHRAVRQAAAVARRPAPASTLRDGRLGGTDVDIKAVRERLLRRRDELRQRASDASADLRHEADPLSADFAEQVTQRENDDVLGAISHSARVELQQVEAALRRLAPGATTAARCAARTSSRSASRRCPTPIAAAPAPSARARGAARRDAPRLCAAHPPGSSRSRPTSVTRARSSAS